MKRKMIIVLIIFIFIGIFVIDNDRNPVQEDSHYTNTMSTTLLTPQATSIHLLPPAFIESEPSNRKGRIEKIEYETYLYTGNNEKIIKPAYVYLPYGYDEKDTETKYDIVYLMHGYTESAERMLMQYDIYHNYNLQNILDNMIANGDIKPVIVVTPTFDAKNQSNTYEKSIEEINVFHKEFINELIPAVESKYHTYALTTDKQGIKASREHRAFGGFSMGAATTWNQLIYNLDYIQYFLPMSGDCWAIEPNGGIEKAEETAKYLEEAVKNTGYRKDEFLIYTVTGTDDALYEQVNNQIQAMMALTDTFTNENLKYRWKEGAVHDYNACMEYIYDALPSFFGNTTE